MWCLLTSFQGFRPTQLTHLIKISTLLVQRSARFIPFLPCYALLLLRLAVGLGRVTAKPISEQL
jgi:hypothetical protein